VKSNGRPRNRHCPTKTTLRIAGTAKLESADEENLLRRVPRLLRFQPPSGSVKDLAAVMNEELRDLAASCPLIQIEEPRHHYAALRADTPDLDADVVTVECASSNGRDLALLGKQRTKKIAIGVVSHGGAKLEQPCLLPARHREGPGVSPTFLYASVDVARCTRRG
jgi:methionine synthase II (cobalamin-independent)